MAPKKTASKKIVSKKVIKKKSAKKTSGEKSSTKNNLPNKTARKGVSESSVSTPTLMPEVVKTCMCRQKRNGKFYGFKLQQGRWAQVSGIPFETQEECEEACCDE
jgi:hypothetical protein